MATIFENLRRSAYQRPWMKDYKGGIGSGKRYGEGGNLQQGGFLQPGAAVPKMSYFSSSTPGVQYSSFEEALAVGKEARDTQDIEDYKRYAANLGLPQTAQGFDGYRKEKAQQRQLEEQTAMKNAEIARQQANRNREFAYKMAQAREASARANRAAAQADERNRISRMNALLRYQKGRGTGRGGSGGSGGGGSSSSQINRLMTGIKSGAYNQYNPNEIAQLVQRYGGDEIDLQTAFDSVEQSRLGRGTKATEALDKETKKQVDNINAILATGNLGTLSGVKVDRIPYDTAALLHNKIEDRRAEVERDRKDLQSVKDEWDRERLKWDGELADGRIRQKDYDDNVEEFIKSRSDYMFGVPGDIEWKEVPEDAGDSLADISPFSHLFVNDMEEDTSGKIPEQGEVTVSDAPMSEELLDWEQGLTGESRGVGYANPYDNPMVNRPDDEERMRMAQWERNTMSPSRMAEAERAPELPSLSGFEFLNEQDGNPIIPLDQSDAPSQSDIDELNRLLRPESVADKVPPAYVGRNTMFIDPTSPWDLGSTLEGSGISKGRRSWEGLKAIPANIASLIPEAANALAPFYTIGSVESEPTEVIKQPILNPLSYTNNVKPKVTAEYARETLLPLYLKSIQGFAGDPSGGNADWLERRALGMLLKNYDVVDREFM